MSRYGDSSFFEERERDRTTYAPIRGGRRTREFDEIDVESRRSARPARSVPDFLREDYDRDRTSGALVIREERDTDYERPRRRPERERVEKEEIIIRDEKRSGGSTRGARTVIEEDDLRSVRSGRTARTERTARTAPRGESRSREEIDIKITRDEEQSRPRERSRTREIDDEEIIIRRSDRERPKSVVERDDITFRRGEVERSRPRYEEREKEEIIIRRNRSPSSSPSPPPRRRDSSVVSERIIFKPRERSLPPPRDQMIAREREEFIVRRRKPEPPSPSSSPSPPPPRREEVKEEIIIRRTEREQSPPTPPRIPTPEPEPEPVIETIRRPIIREEIHRDIITHYRNYDHGTEFVRREPSPPPLPPPPEPEPVREEKLEVAIRRRDVNGESQEDIIFEERKGGRRRRESRSRANSVVSRRETIIEEDTRSRKELIVEDDTRSVTTARSRRDRSLSRGRDDFDLSGEAEFYNRKALERARIGEAYNGATREWELVDVPPGTSRVKMDGIGGGSQEITWQRYNGARRSRFLADGQDYVGYPDFEERRERIREEEVIPAPPPPAPEPVVEEKTKTLEISIRDRDVGGSSGAIVKREKKPKEMWTEVTKDLVIKEAIEQVGYGYEETEYYFYVMEYLKYEDVLALVQLSDDIRHARKHRIKEIELERDYMNRGSSRRKDREFEEEIIYERRRRH